MTRTIGKDRAFGKLLRWKRNMEELLSPNDYQKENCLKIKSHIEKRNSLNFKYLKGDNSTKIYKNVYPLRLFKRDGHIYFEAFSSDLKKFLTFRLDRVLVIGLLESILSEQKIKPSDFIGLLIALLIIISIFLLLILFSPKIRWRYMRMLIFGY